MSMPKTLYEYDYPIEYIGMDCSAMFHGDYLKIVDAIESEHVPDGYVVAEHYFDRGRYLVPVSLIRKRTL